MAGKFTDGPATAADTLFDSGRPLVVQIAPTASQPVAAMVPTAAPPLWFSSIESVATAPSHVGALCAWGSRRPSALCFGSGAKLASEGSASFPVSAERIVPPFASSESAGPATPPSEMSAAATTCANVNSTVPLPHIPTPQTPAGSERTGPLGRDG